MITHPSSHASREAGQAAPIYITMVAGLLFLALAFFAVGQAGASRNGTQAAADAAALAAAQESRDQFRGELLDNLLTPGYLDDIFNGDPLGTTHGCVVAARFAHGNKADLDGAGGCRALSDRWGFAVSVVSQKPMGDSILSGTKNERATAEATAVVEPRCGFEPAEDETKPSEEPPDPAPDDSAAPDDPAETDPDDTAQASPGSLVCDGTKWSIDPGHLELLPDMADLFSVRLAQD
ncbi:pilus assembly protein TadG-related protein [Streptomyces sp. NPDC088116]|uniref:pilus assembly protein TadG-related protein n=1 Tax=Streptomyces sp. NPDC088116 TaxID=3365825 RepID=UPI00380A6C58